MLITGFFSEMGNNVMDKKLSTNNLGESRHAISKII